MKKSICMIIALAGLICRVVAQEMTSAMVQDGHSDKDQPVRADGGFRTMEDLRFRAVGRDRLGKVRMEMDRPHIEGDRIYLRVKLNNRSAISYDVDLFRIYVRDRKTSRRTVTQEQEMVPAWSYTRSQRVNARSAGYFIFVMDKFTLANEKILQTEVFEKGGGRNFQVRVSDSKLNKAQQF